MKAFYRGSPRQAICHENWIAIYAQQNEQEDLDDAYEVRLRKEELSQLEALLLYGPVSAWGEASRSAGDDEASRCQEYDGL